MVFKLISLILFAAILASGAAGWRKGLIRKSTFLLLCFMWLALIMELVYYEQLDAVAKAIGVDRSVDVIVYLSISVLFMFFLHLYFRIIQQGKDLREICIRIALREQE